MPESDAATNGENRQSVGAHKEAATQNSGLLDETRVLYVSPRKALSHDIKKPACAFDGHAETFRHAGGAPPRQAAHHLGCAVPPAPTKDATTDRSLSRFTGFDMCC